ncbi:MAG: CoA-binding protein, partial [Actinomycetota bacterium]|nr:CoA-binding protein [Actinomycetota bacterium]
MFYPENVAIYGASSSEKNMGKNIVQNLIEWEFKGKVFPVNPRGEDVLGLKGYSSLKEIGEPVDLVVAIVPAKVVPRVMDECHEVGVESMAIPSGGFSELGEEGEELTSLIDKKAKEYGIRFVGPNGLTIINAANGLCLPFTLTKKREKGEISIITQSGGLGLTLIMFLDNAERGFSKFISVGNKVNMDELDFLEYLAQDPETKVICMFLESLVRGREFLELASSLEKPLIVYKANTTEVGAKTAKSHTAALVNNEAVLEGVFRQGGVYRARTIKGLIDSARAFELPPMRGNRIAVVTQAGGYAVLTADEAYKAGFEFPSFSSDMLEDFRKYVRGDVIRLGNPLD